MDKNSLNIFLLGTLTGFATFFVLDWLVLDELFSIPTPEAESAGVPMTILSDMENRMIEANRKARDLETELAELKDELAEAKAALPDPEPRFMIDDEDRTDEFRELRQMQQTEQITQTLRDLSSALELNRKQQESLREILARTQKAAGDFSPVSYTFERGSDLRRNLEPLLTSGQQAALDEYVENEMSRRVEDRADTWMMQLLSAVELSEEQQSRAREAFLRVARTRAQMDTSDTTGKSPPTTRNKEALADILTKEQMQTYGESLEGYNPLSGGDE